MRTHVLVLALAFAFVGCGSSPSPTQPSPSVPVATRWIIAHRFASVEGPDNCWIRFQRERLTGVVFSGLDSTITRQDGSIRFSSPWFQDYVGTSSGTDFSADAVAALPGGAGQCPEGGVSYPQLPGTSKLMGRFADGDQTLTGNEVNSYRLTTGELVTYTWAWTGTRQQ